jgi:hypothetical protein
MLQPLRRTERRRPRFVITGIRNGEEFKRITAQPEPRWEQERKEESRTLVGREPHNDRPQCAATGLLPGKKRQPCWPEDSWSRQDGSSPNV